MEKTQSASRLSGRGGEVRDDAALLDAHAGHGAAELGLDAALLCLAQQKLRHVLVYGGHGQEAVQAFNDGDLAAEGAEDEGELAAHHAAADDEQPLRHPVELQGLVAREHPLAVAGKRRQAEHA